MWLLERVECVQRGGRCKVAVLLREMDGLEVMQIFSEKDNVSLLIRWKGVPMVVRSVYCPHAGHHPTKYYEVLNGFQNGLSYAT